MTVQHSHTIREEFRSVPMLCVLAAAVLTIGIFLTWQSSATAQNMGNGPNYGMRDGMGNGMGHRMRHHGAGGAGHDEVNMPGLRGLDATDEESAELAEMFRNFQRITREVSNLPNGIHTTTYSESEELMSVVVSHVVGMIERVKDGRDPKVFIQSPTLDVLFEHRDQIVTSIETTDEGIVVAQTSDNPDVVTALQTHAAEVSDMVDHGMAAVHEMMMKRAEN